MFPFIFTSPANEPGSFQNESLPPGRLDVQRTHLEHTKMYHLNTMAVEESYSRLEKDMVTRRQIAIATEGQTSSTARFRVALGSFIVAVGQRIQPTTNAPIGDPRFNA